MFYSSPFGQTPNSLFGSQSMSGQTTNAASNPFVHKPFPCPFGARIGSSFYGSSSTGVFGNQNSSPLVSTSVFGDSSSPAFGPSTPAFGVSSAPAFSGSSSFGGISVFGQKPAFGAIVANTTETSPFGSSFPHSQPSFGIYLLGSLALSGASSQPAFGTPSKPAFGSAVSPAFDAIGGAFGVSSSPVFGSTSPAFGAANTPAFGASSVPVFGSTSSPSFSFGSSSAFGQSPSAFGDSPFGIATTPFGTQSQVFCGAPASTQTFGSSGFEKAAFRTQRGGSRVAPFVPIAEVPIGTQPAGKLESMSAMPIYKDMSHEEFRWEDYQLGDKGTSVYGLKPAFGAFGANTTESSPFGISFQQLQPSFGIYLVGSLTLFGASGAASSPLFGATSSPLFGAISTPAFGSAVSPAFGATGSTLGISSSSIFGSSSPAFGAASTSAFGAASTPAFGASSAPAFGSTSSPSFSFGSSPAFGQSPSTFGSTPFGHTTTTPSGTQSQDFWGAPASTQTSGGSGFGQAAFGTLLHGSRVAAYVPTAEADTGTQPRRKT